MVNFARDLKYALRTLRRSPLFTTIALVSLALGIGANTAIFSLVNQLILENLPVRHPEQLVLLTSRGEHYGSNTGSNAISYPMYQDIRDRNPVFSGMFCRYRSAFSIQSDGRTELVMGELVSGNYFPVLGVGAAVGRLFTANDDLIQGGHPLAVLSYSYWKTRYAGDPSVIGKRVLVSGYPLTIVGVSQDGFDGVEPGSAPQIRIPMAMLRQVKPEFHYTLNDRRGRFVQAFGRLRPGVTAAGAKAGLQPLFHQILDMEVQQKEFSRAAPYTKQQFLKMWMDLLPAAKGRSYLRDQFAKPLWALMAIVGLVLLIACSNLANLLIARSTARRKEIAVRLAMGASRKRLVWQLMEESLLLSLAGGAAGVLLAIWLDKTLIGFLPPSVAPVAISSAPDWGVLGFAVAVAVGASLLFGLAPALQSTRPDLAGTLKDQAGAVVGGSALRLRKGLVIAQVALSLLLMIGAGLFAASLNNLRGLKPGFSTENLITFSADPTLSGYDRPKTRQFYRTLAERLRTYPGARSSALAVVALLDDNEWDSTVTVEGYTTRQGEYVDPHMQFTTPNFFETMKIPLLEGRDFTLRDDENTLRVAIVNEKFARRYFGNASPIGRHLGMGGDPGVKTDIEIVGVVGDTRYENLREPVPYELYLPYSQQKFVVGMRAYVRVHGDPEALLADMRRVVREVDAAIPIANLRTLEQQVDKSLLTERLLASLSGLFGGLATLLAAIGVYGVMAYLVTQRTREIGIRMALGASSGSVVWLVMREVLLLAGIGVVIGVPAAWALARLVEAQLFGIVAGDARTIVLAVAGIAAVAAFSGLVPARRASGIDPMRALRWE